MTTLIHAGEFRVPPIDLSPDERQVCCLPCAREGFLSVMLRWLHRNTWTCERGHTVDAPPTVDSALAASVNGVGTTPVDSEL